MLELVSIMSKKSNGSGIDDLAAHLRGQGQVVATGRFRLDWEKGTSTLESIYYLAGPDDLAITGTGPQTPIYVGDRLYLTNAHNDRSTSGPSIAGIWQMRGGLAVLVAALWLGTSAQPPAEPLDVVAPPSSAPVGAPPSAAPMPRVVGEMSRILVEARPAADGQGFEVLYVRRMVERAVVPRLWEITEDEHGDPVPAQVSLARFAPASRY